MKLDVEVRGLARSIEFLTGVDKDADRAQQTALRAVSRRARAQARRELAARFGVPAKIFAKRVRWFARKPRQRGVRRYALWAGMLAEPRPLEHPRVAKAIAARNPAAFYMDTSAGRRLFVRVAGKLRVPKLETDAAMLEIIPLAARRAMAERYVATLVNDFNRRKARRANRR